MLTLLYRGSLASCNYACSYCPFGKRRDSRAALARDAAELHRFVAWAGAQTRPLRMLFTPWGEALVRRHYREALLALARLPHISQVALQTNLSGPLAWLADAPPGKLALCCTYHPTQVPLARFVERVRRLRALGVRHSVGVVARREHHEAIRALKDSLPEGTPFWLNAYDRRGPGYHTPDELAWLEALDPWYGHSHAPAPSRGVACRAGSESLTVDGDGELRRCHFIPTRLGNLYTDVLDEVLQERRCSRLRCECFIGYAQRRDLGLHEAFGEGLLARIPVAVQPPARS